MYRQAFNFRRKPLVFRQFGNKGYSLFCCLGREVVCSVLSVATLTYASAESVSTHPVVGDSTATTTAREMLLEEVSVTGSRAPLTKSQAARMVTVLERADIQQAPVQSINDLLKYAIGVDVRQRGPIGAQTDISIRGGTSEQIILLLNGINICDPQTGHNAMDLPVDLSDVVRIEVIEGPAGRLYGTSSLVGAINIVTREAAGPQPGERALTLHAEGGSYGYANIGARGRLTKAASPLYSTLSANYSRSDGYSRSKAGNLNTGYSGTKLFWQGQWQGREVTLHWHAGLADKGWGSSTFYASPKWQADDQYEHTLKTYTALQAHTRQGRLRLGGSIYWQQNRDRYEGYRGRPDLMKYNYNRTDVYGVSLNGYFDWGNPDGDSNTGNGSNTDDGRGYTGGSGVRNRTAFGAELRNEDLVSGNLGEPLAQPRHIAGTDRDYTLGLNRTNISGFLEHNLIAGPLTLSAGLVATKNTWSNMSMSIYPGVDISYRPSERVKLHASWNTSLRMPSFTEMYYKVQGYAADPHLKPEEMQAVDLGLTLNAAPLSLTASLWYHHGKNMIDWIMDTSQGSEAVWLSVNHTRINSIGAEVKAAADLLQAFPAQSVLRKIEVCYSYISQDKTQEEGIVSQYALEYLRHKLVAQAQLQIVSRLSLGVSVRWQQRIGSYTDFGGEVCAYKPYAVADARLCWQQQRWKAYVEANNLLDTSYRDYGLVEQPGRWLIAGFSISL